MNPKLGISRNTDEIQGLDFLIRTTYKVQLRLYNLYIFVFFIEYHSLNKLFPLVTLSRQIKPSWKTVPRSAPKYTLKVEDVEYVKHDGDLPTLESVQDVDIEMVFNAFVRKADTFGRRSSLSVLGEPPDLSASVASDASASTVTAPLDEPKLSLNVMQFSTIWRLLTGDKGNLFKEMQIFHK